MSGGTGGHTFCETWLRSTFFGNVYLPRCKQTRKVILNVINRVSVPCSFFGGRYRIFCFVVVPSHVGNGRAGKWAARGNVSIGSACRWGICIRFLLKVSRSVFSSFLRFNNLSRLLRWQCAVISRKAGNSRHSILFCRRRRFLSFFFCLHHAATEPPIRLKSHSFVRSFLLTSSFYSPTDRPGWRWEWQKNINKQKRTNKREEKKNRTNKTAWTIKILRHGWWKSETTTGDRTPNEKT